LEAHEREQQQRELEAAQKLAEAERKRAEEQIKRRRLQRYFRNGLAVLLLGAVFLTVYAFEQQLAALRATKAARFATKKTSNIASRGNVSLARYS
jgi:hypothetical protein